LPFVTSEISPLSGHPGGLTSPAVASTWLLCSAWWAYRWSLSGSEASSCLSLQCAHPHATNPASYGRRQEQIRNTSYGETKCNDYLRTKTKNHRLNWVGVRKGRCSSGRAWGLPYLSAYISSSLRLGSTYLHYIPERRIGGSTPARASASRN